MPRQGRASVLASPDLTVLGEKFGLARTLALPVKGFSQRALLTEPELRALGEPQ
jgi:hypothetical protein